MQQQNAATPAKDQPSKSTLEPARLPVPKPIDPALLRHVGGGIDPTATPTRTW